MPTPTPYAFSFVVDGTADDTFAVVSFKGHEYVSRPYRFELVLASDKADLAAKDFVYKDCRLKIDANGTKRTFHGMVFLFRHVKKTGQKYIYQVVLAPRLQMLTLFTRSRVFLHQDSLSIIKNILKDVDIPVKISIPSDQNFPVREYTCQFNETDFDFISRWLEARGVSYYFETKKDDDTEVLVLADAQYAQKTCRKEALQFSPPSGMEVPREDVLQSFISEHCCLPKHVFLKDYDNQGQPAISSGYEAQPSKVAQGVVWKYGASDLPEKYKLGQQSIIAQELESSEVIYQGKSFCPDLRAGATLKVKGHYRDDYNGVFYLYHVQHEGSDSQRALNGHQHGHETGEGQMYANTFNAVTASCHYRPRRSTPVPQFSGLLTAFVEEGGSQESEGKYAKMDDQGRYQVRLPFDLWVPDSKKQATKPEEKGKASHWIRLAEPYAGNAAGESSFGMHFPLLKGTEVLISFVEGDIDRPVIVNALYNKVHTNPVTSSNAPMNIIRTKSGNSIEIDDTEGKESVSIASAGKKSMVTYSPDGITTVTSTKAITTSKSNSFSASYGSTASFTAGSSLSGFGGTKTSVTLGFSASTTIGISFSADFGAKVAIGGQKSMIDSDFSATAEEDISLKSGMSISLKSYYNQIKAWMTVASVASVGTGFGSWALGAAGSHKTGINEAAAMVGGTISEAFGIFGQAVGSVMALGCYNMLKSEKAEALYTTTFTLGKKGAELTVHKPKDVVGTSPTCQFEVKDSMISGKSSFIKIFADGDKIQLNNREKSLLTMDGGTSLVLSVDQGGSAGTVTLDKSKGIVINSPDSGKASLASSKVTLENKGGSKLELEAASAVMQGNASNYLKASSSGIDIKFQGSAGVSGSGTMKVNPQGMLMLC